MKISPRLISCRLLRHVVLALFFLAGSRLWATTVVPPDFDQLVNDADYIIRAVVKSVDSEYQPTNGGGKKIVTKVALDVKEVIAGIPPKDVVLEMLGGRVGDERMVVEGAPTFKVGDEDILFVRGNGHTIVPLVAMMHGRYPILREPGTGRKYMARDNRIPLMDTAEIAQPITKAETATVKAPAKAATQAMTPEEFIQQIKSAVNPRYVRTKS
ncbi:MAG: hypothetical protein ABI273_16990 [Lacunisphaera sp.]